MMMAIAILLLELALAGGLLAARGEDRRNMPAAAWLALAATLGATGLLWLGLELPPLGPTLLAALGATVSLAWLALLVDKPARRGNFSVLPAAGLVLQLCHGLVAVQLLVVHFAGKNPGFPFSHPIPLPLMLMMLMAAVGTGAVLLSAGLLGVTEWLGRGEAAEPEVLLSAATRVRRMVVARLLAVSFSLLIGMAFDPISARHFVFSLPAEAVVSMWARLVLGLVLPIFYGLLMTTSVREGPVGRSAAEFLPLLLLLMLGELIGAAITVGMWGVAF